MFGESPMQSNQVTKLVKGLEHKLHEERLEKGRIRGS